MTEPQGSPLLRAFLRTLAFLGPIEAIFFRLLPPPEGPSLTALARAHESLHRAGELAFWLSLALAIVLLITLARTALTSRIWPPGLNGFLAVCLMSQAALGIGAAIGETPGPAFAAAFTLIAVMAAMAIATHAYAAAAGFMRAFLVTYVSSVLCSGITTVASFGHRLGIFSMPVAVAGASYTAGLILLALSGVLAFLAFTEPMHLFDLGKKAAFFAVVTAASASLGFAAACLLGDASIAPLGTRPSVPLVLQLSFAIFAGGLSIAANLLSPERRFVGYGLLLMLLAGFPQRIALQDMLMVLGAALLLAPRRAPATMQTASPPPPYPADEARSADRDLIRPPLAGNE